MLAKECLEEFLLDCDLRRLSPRTIKSYKNNISRTLDYINIHFQVIELEEINHQHIRRYMQRLKQKGLSATYANGILKGLRSYFNYAIQEGYLLRSPADKVHWQKEPVKIIETFTNDEVRRMLNVYKRTDFLSVRNKLILAIAFDTGARNSEICEMKTSDIGSNVILIHGKGSKEGTKSIQRKKSVWVEQHPHGKRPFRKQRLRMIGFIRRRLGFYILTLFRYSPMESVL